MKIFPASIIKPIAQKVPRESRSTPQSTKWGIDHEKTAIDGYLMHKQIASQKIRVVNSGLVVNAKWPWPGCSPDGIVVENGSPIGCI